MSKLIVEMEMNGIPNCCGLCDPLVTVVCATKHDQTIDKMMLRAGRPSWCPICGVLPEEHGDLIDRDALLKECYPDDEFDAHVIYADDIHKAEVVIAAERRNA